MVAPTHQEAVKVLRAQFERQKAEKYKPEVARGLHLKNRDGSFQVSSIEQEFQAWAEGYRAATSQVEAATSEASSRWSQTEAEALFIQCNMLHEIIYKFHQALGHLDDPEHDVCFERIKALAAPQALPATEQANCPGHLLAENKPVSALNSMQNNDLGLAYGRPPAQAKPDLLGLKRYDAGITNQEHGVVGLVPKSVGRAVLLSDVAALLTHPVAQAKPGPDDVPRYSYSEDGKSVMLLNAPPEGSGAVQAKPGLLHALQGLMEYAAFIEERFDSVATDAARAAIAANKPEVGWQPIETAPKDRMIMLGRPANEDEDRGAISTPGRWYQGFEDAPDDMGHDGGFMDSEFQQFSYPRSFGAEKYRTTGIQPTHWRELPAPPAATKPEGSA